ncbi:MAG: UvrD-helicase domain-containing protein [Candidatus Omnitrophica bacterium]|nr:UvrD-helicase domain-containing protein [Candidatus Omnitrophota bacterium]
MNVNRVNQNIFPHVIILEASAGSGKTYALARRYIQLLINPQLNSSEIPLNTILAITFTNKAALEMKKRILEFIKKIALDRFENENEKNNILTALGVDEEAAREKSHKIIDALFKNYNFFQVQTIDSFINAILSGCAFRLDLSAGFKTRKEYRDYLEYCLDKLIDRVGEDKEVQSLFHNFIKRYLLIENKAGWFPKEDILSILDSIYSKNNKLKGKFAGSDIEANVLIALKKRVLNLMGALRSGSPEKTNKQFLNSLTNFLEDNKEGFDIDNLPDFFKREEFPLNKGGDMPGRIRQLWQDIRESIITLCEKESKSTYNYYIDIFNKVLDNLKDITAKDDILFLGALNKKAQGLLGDESLLPELYCRLAIRFKHFLLDEFQDTSILQWDNLIIMIEEALAGGGSLFYVGDKKQAIYRFRGGEVFLIDYVKKRFHGYDLKEDALNKNYRSRKEIVGFNNNLFSKENLARFIAQVKARENARPPAAEVELSDSDVEKVLDIFKDSKQDYDNVKTGGYICVEFTGGNKAEEIRNEIKVKLLNLLKDLTARFHYKDIALLARKNDEIKLLTSWLLEANIPVESEKTLNVRENSYIKEIVSFLKFLNSPIDNLSFASFILGDIFCRASGIDSRVVHDFIFTNEALRAKSPEFLKRNPRVSLHPRLKSRGFEASWDNRSAGSDKGLYLYREFRRRFPDIWNKFIEEFFKSVGFIPVYELVISILSKFNVVREFYGYQCFFMRFLELIKGYEEEHSDISSFLKFFENAKDEEMYVDAGKSNSIKALTIHKAKGLEFPVTVVPFLELNIKIDPMVTVINEDDINLLHIKKQYSNFSPFLAELYSEQYLKYFIDELNSIYVSLTRAKDELYIFVPPKAERSSNMARHLFPCETSEYGNKQENNKGSSNEERLAIEIPYSEYGDWIPFLKEEFVDEHILKGREELLRGDISHYILSFIGNLHGQDKEKVFKDAVERARSRYPSFQQFDECAATVGRLLDNEQFHPYFEVKAGDVYTEKEIADSSGNAGRIDRLIVNKKEALIIDYKSARGMDAAYNAQITGYIKIIRDVYPDLNVKGILIYLDDMSMERVNAENRNL